MNSRQEFSELLAAESVDLVHVALLAAQILAADSQAAVAATARGREQLAELIAAASAAGCTNSVANLVDFVATQEGFGGNSENYYAPENSNLAHVLTHKRGIPITLALVYIGVGRGLGLDLRGIGFPGHFLVGCYDPASGKAAGSSLETALIDPFAGAQTSRQDALEKLRAMHRAQSPGRELPEEQVEQWFQPASAAQITLRLLENLKQIHLHARASGPALAALELQLLVAPEQFDLRAQHEALLGQVFGRDSGPGAPQVH